jgi:hypothetical protein
MIDFEALGPVPEERLRQADPAALRLKGAPARADTLLPEDAHYQASSRIPGTHLDSSQLGVGCA